LRLNAGVSRGQSSVQAIRRNQVNRSVKGTPNSEKRPFAVPDLEAFHGGPAGGHPIEQEAAPRKGNTARVPTLKSRSEMHLPGRQHQAIIQKV
jgi:hypothetical protein